MSQLFDEAVQFTDEITGQLLVNGLLYIGENGLDAKLNPITIYPDRELSGTPLANPQQIGSDGRAINKIWLAGKYSFKVEDSANVQKYNELENGFDEQVGNTLLINSLGVDDVVVNGSPTVTTLVDSQTYIFTAPADNTGAMTLKIDNTAVLPLKIRHDQAVSSGEIKQGQKIVVVYNLADSIFEVVNDLSGVTLNGVETLTNKTLTSPIVNSPVINTPNIIDPILNGNATGTVVETVTLSTSIVKLPSSSLVHAKTAGLNTKIIEIGDWNMDTTASVSVTHGVTASKIRTISVLIRSDIATSHHDLNLTNNGETIGSDQGVYASLIDIVLQRATNGYFDNANYNLTSYNRGWITIQYTD